MDNIDDGFEKGKKFEQFVCSLFPTKTFDLIHATSTRDDLGGRKVEENKLPDFRFRDKGSKNSFWVECKFRSGKFNEKIPWATSYQFNRYKEFQVNNRSETVFVIIGFEGEPSNPKSLYCIPLDEIQYPGLYPSAIDKYRRLTDKQFYYENGQLI